MAYLSFAVIVIFAVIVGVGFLRVLYSPKLTERRGSREGDPA